MGIAFEELHSTAAYSPSSMESKPSFVAASIAIFFLFSFSRTAHMFGKIRSMSSSLPDPRFANAAMIPASVCHDICGVYTWTSIRSSP